MSVAKKNRRKLVREGRLFVWWVQEDRDSLDLILHVVSEDKRFIAHYVLGQEEAERLIIILGSEFAGADTGGNWSRFHCPCFDPHAVVTPGNVRQLIDWCLTDEGPRSPLRWQDGYPWNSYGSPPDVEGYLQSLNEGEA